VRLAGDAVTPAIMRVRCPKAATPVPHLSVDIGQPVSMSRLASLLKAVSRCVCGAEMIVEAPRE
jgi:hypothetical protein